MATGVCIDCGCVHKYSENCELNVIIFEANRYIYKNTSLDEVERIVNLTFTKLKTGSEILKMINPKLKELGEK